MQTNFTAEQLKDPVIAEANGILRSCVHCGFCTATCPTYTLLGDELDSPRGRIYLIKGMLESGGAPDADTVKHVDRCLSCLSCMTTCPSGVHYMHLVDDARTHIEKHYKRPFVDRALRRVLAWAMPEPGRFHAAVKLAKFGKPFAKAFEAAGLKPIAALLRISPQHLPVHEDMTGVHPASGTRKGRVALLTGCVQTVLQPEINAATIRLLTRLGVEVVVDRAQGCCGSIDHHMGREEAALVRARRNIDLWSGADIDAVVINTSGCGTVVKDYGHMFRLDPAYAEKAKRVAAKTRDITEYLLETGLPARPLRNLRVAYHSACSMQHGQNIKTQPRKLLETAGFTVLDVPEGHLCCGSAGTYNILQSDIAERLKARKVANIESVAPDIVATGNIGCNMQIAGGTNIPIVHTVELLDWATGGPRPPALG